MRLALRLAVHKFVYKDQANRAISGKPCNVQRQPHVEDGREVMVDVVWKVRLDQEGRLADVQVAIGWRVASLEWDNVRELGTPRKPTAGFALCSSRGRDAWTVHSKPSVRPFLVPGRRSASDTNEVGNKEYMRIGFSHNVATICGKSKVYYEGFRLAVCQR